VSRLTSVPFLTNVAAVVEYRRRKLETYLQVGFKAYLNMQLLFYGHFCWTTYMSWYQEWILGFVHGKQCVFLFVPSFIVMLWIFKYFTFYALFSEEQINTGKMHGKKTNQLNCQS